ncbi:MAG: DNA-protecting protein DprA [SAR202 cluster bacterium]|nr:DNA-protecting protein DprA [SAR202 cluster bacterium]
MEEKELKYWISFNRIPHIGRVRVRLLESHFGSLSDAWRAGIAELKRAGLDERSAQSIVSERDGIKPDDEVGLLTRNGIKAYTWHDREYPPRLKEIEDLPPVLYVRGEMTTQDERSIAIVGTRKATPYGRQVAHQLSFDLAQAGMTIVSGLALGIDGVAHRAAIEAGKRTIAVVASGLDIVYPREHTRLASEVAQHGAVVSEHPVGTQPKAEYFPRRNRIISGMTLGTVVVEAGEESGALITARHAIDQNREVFAVPGSIMSLNSKGANRIIQRSEAKLVCDYKDVLDELNLSGNSGKQLQLAMEAFFPASDQESQIMYYLTHEPIHIDEIIRGSGLNISTVSSVLAMMELRGMVRQVGGMNYVRV